MIEIDGSVGEGGGQILRTSLALSMCTGQPFALSKIRAGRAKPGLMRQHLTCVNAAAEISGAEVEGAELNSQSLTFTPGRVLAGDYTFNVGTAGSCTLVLQTVWPALMLADANSQLKLSGGTHNPMAPPFHFLERSYAPLLRKLGAEVELELRRLGFYPAGGGEIEVKVWPAGDRLQPFDLIERGAKLEGYAECFAPALPRSVARRELQQLGADLGWSDEQLREAASRQNEGPGNALLATLVYENVCEVVTGFGEKGVSAEQVARDVVREVRSYQVSDGALGPHLADQWTLPLALAVWRRGGAASYTCTELTPHALTNFETIELFLPVRFSTSGSGSHWCVSVEAR
ncbi:MULTISPECIES: RNA 3'-terminal phosphate cyclase [unclassified Roseateles]|uniref:RNA 3'-terminal phosphate cyclase n=1 Tax=unclassified Roseateles TaxID=2626991 RepID=UPI000701B54A|nr:MULTISPECIES: RNA 3'-terminal phosphate cyclase [unclassified Roseateles]KQW45317.1 RNA 3'-phosphate cyclase [Pelomonas sp. Root405]KRA72161.1 RNA 3'-phosphate cyclase [Pelomonas sp. Root662]